MFFITRANLLSLLQIRKTHTPEIFVCSPSHNEDVIALIPPNDFNKPIDTHSRKKNVKIMQGSESRRRVFIIGGPRFSGKDYVAGRICACVEGSEFWNASLVVKKEFCAIAGLSFDRMLADREYKEMHRPAMTAYFHKQITEHGQEHYVNQLVQIAKTSDAKCLVFDVRFRLDCLVSGLRDDRTSILKLRVQASDETRRRRGWVYDPAVDEDVTEIDLRGYQGWDATIDNDVDGSEQIDEQLSLVSQK